MAIKRNLQEQLERMKYVSRYSINESPVYKSLVGNSGIDALPEYLMKEADSGSTANGPAPETPALPTDAGVPPVDASALPMPADAGAAPEMPPSAAPVQGASGASSSADIDVDKNVDITTAGAPSEELPSDQSMPMGEPVETPESAQKRVMELQLDALRKMSDKIEDLGNAVDGINQRMAVYSAEVDKVREPSDMEKFGNRKDDSSPYYYNLNDLWQGDNFKSRMDQFSKGYVKTEDGYIADFDDLPKLAPHEVKASFDA